jgi:hypothetical protein
MKQATVFDDHDYGLFTQHPEFGRIAIQHMIGPNARFEEFGWVGRAREVELVRPCDLEVPHWLRSRS